MTARLAARAQSEGGWGLTGLCPPFCCAGGAYGAARPSGKVLRGWGNCDAFRQRGILADQIEAISHDQNAIRLLGAPPHLIDTGDMFAWQDDKFVLPTEHLERGQPREVFLSQHRERELTWSEKDHIIAAIASGLRYALRRGVIHRDVRPHNIVIAPGGQVKLDLAIHEPASGAAARCPALAASDFAIGSSTQGQPRPYASRHIRSSSLPERDLPPRATKFTNRPG